jgi:hypothetical protein
MTEIEAQEKALSEVAQVQMFQSAAQYKARADLGIMGKVRGMAQKVIGNAPAVTTTEQEVLPPVSRRAVSTEQQQADAAWAAHQQAELENRPVGEEFFDIRTAEEFTGGALSTYSEWYNNLPRQVKRSLILLPNADIIVDKKRWSETHEGREFPEGQIGAGRTFRLGKKAFVQFALGAPETSGNHEIFHAAQAMMLNDNELKVLKKAFGSLENQAEAFERYRLEGHSDSAIGNIFRKIQSFLESLGNLLRGQGFNSVESIFGRVSRGDVYITKANADLAVFYQTRPRKSFLTPQGTLPVTSQHASEFPQGKEQNWVRKNSIVDQGFYSMGELTDQNIALIENDIDENQYQMEFVIETPGNYVVISREGYEDAGFNLRRAMQKPLYSKDMSTTRDEMYSTVEKDITNESYKQGTVGNVHQEGGWNNFVKKIPGLKNLQIAMRTNKNDMNVLESVFELPAFAQEKFPVVAELINIQNDRERKRFEMFQMFKMHLRPYNETTPEVRNRVDSLLIRGDNMGAEWTKEEVLALPDGYNEDEANAYVAMRKTLDMAAVMRQDRLRQEQADIEAMKEPKNEQKNEFLDKQIEQIQEQIDQIDEWFDKGYLPHVWNGKYWIRFTMTQENWTPKIAEAMKQVADIKGEDTNNFLSQFGRLGKDDTTVRFNSENVSQHNEIIRVLTEAGIREDNNYLQAGDNAQSNNVFEEASRAEARKVMDQLIDAIEKKEGDTAETQAKVDQLRAEFLILDKAQGWRRHELHRNGALGYNTNDLQSVVSGYLSGYAGLSTKTDAAIEFAEQLGTISSTQQPRLYKYADGFVRNALHNSDTVDKWQNRISGFIFSKFLGFNPVFHMRNEFQNYYVGLGVMNQHGISSKKALPILMKAHWDVNQKGIPFFSFNYYGAPGRENPQWYSDNVSGKTEEEGAVLAQGGIDGVYDAGMRGELFKDLEKSKDSNKVFRTFKNSYAAYVNHSGRFVQMSDQRNRVHYLLAAYRALTDGKELPKDQDFDREAYDEAVKMVNETNVVYKGWNSPPALWSTSRVRALKPLFQFQKFGWHVTRLQLKYGLGLFTPGMRQKSLGALSSMYIMTALLGGVSTLPFWEKIREIFGMESAAKARNAMVKELGGGSAILQAIDGGLLGFTGMDFSYQLQLRPLALADPLFGENAVMSMINDIGKAKDDLRRGRIAKAIFEGPHMPGFMKKLSRAYRTATEGVTTFRGDVVLDLQGAPMKMSTYEIAMSAMGFMPRKLQNHYKGQRFTRDLKAYWGKRKSELGTKYKVASAKGNKQALTELEREIKYFNARVRDNKVGGELPTSLITPKTLSNWLRGAGSETERKLQANYYPE